MAGKAQWTEQEQGWINDVIKAIRTNDAKETAKSVALDSMGKPCLDSAGKPCPGLPIAAKRGEILRAAEQMVNGSRQEDYGDPEDNFSKIAKLWSAYCDFTFSAHDVAMMLSLMKVGRISAAYKQGKYKKDSYIDGPGYIACAGEIASRTAIKEISTIDATCAGEIRANQEK